MIKERGHYKIYSGLITFVFFLVLSSTEFAGVSEYVPYLKYSMLIFGIFFIISSSFIVITPLKLLDRGFAFIIILISILLRPFQFSLGAILNFIFILSALIPFLFKTNYRINIKFLNYGLIVPLIANILFKGGLKVQFSIDAFLRSETSSGESNMIPFLIGLFLIFWILKRDKTMIILNTILLIISFKRIVFLAILIALIFIVFKRLEIFKRRALFICINFFYVFFSFYITTQQFADLAYAWTGLPIGHLTQGRTTFSSILIPYFEEKWHLLFYGIGQSNILPIIEKSLGYFTLFHNDIAKLLLEHGLIIFSLFFYYLYKIPTKFYPLPIFINICLATDNIMIYTPVITLYLLLLNLLQHDNHDLVINP